MVTDDATREPLLDVKNLVVEYPGRLRRGGFRALHGVSLQIEAGKTLGLVGESGSGKTTIGRAILGLAPVTEGDIRFHGRSIARLSGRRRRALSSDIQVVFQDPYTSLNPAMTVADILTEPLLASGTSRRDANERVRGLLEQVHLPANSGAATPGVLRRQRQRIAIARALCREPRLIVCDEPVSALDQSTQARVLDLLEEIQQRLGVAICSS